MGDFVSNSKTTIQHVLQSLERNRTAALCVAVAALTLLAWSNRFIQDDAFISFQYARNLVEGAGLSWNPGERVEGYTNFLWTLLMAIPFWLEIDPVRFAQGLGLALYPGTLFMAYRIAHSATGSALTALLALLLLGTNYSFSIYATGGLETQLHVFILLGMTWLSLREANGSPLSPARASVISLLAAAALLTRLDSAVYLCVLYGYLAIESHRIRSSVDGDLRWSATLLLLPGAVIVVAWLAWKLWYYGDILPNTYYAKMIPLSDSWRPGLRYLWIFTRSYWLLPALAFALLLLRPIAKRGNRRLALLACMALAGLGYAIRTAGDFMEFRALVPILPPLFILLAWLMVRVCPRPLLSAAVALIVIGGSVHHARSFVWDHGIESLARLQGHLYDPAEAWVATGRLLGELFDDEDDPVRIATTAAGALPFYARLPVIDMHGLSDRSVARNGLRANPEIINPGHHRLASFEYLAERRVNLVVGRPVVLEKRPGPRPTFDRDALARFGLPYLPDAESMPDDAVMKVLEIDLDASHRLFVVYLIRHERIDAVVRERDIRRHAIVLARHPHRGPPRAFLPPRPNPAADRSTRGSGKPE